MLYELKPEEENPRLVVTQEEVNNVEKCECVEDFDLTNDEIYRIIYQVNRYKLYVEFEPEYRAHKKQQHEALKEGIPLVGKLRNWMQTPSKNKLLRKKYSESLDEYLITILKEMELSLKITKPQRGTPNPAIYLHLCIGSLWLYCALQDSPN